MQVNAFWLMLGALGVYAISYRYYSAFLAAKVLALDDSRVTPAHRLNDGQNYHPTNRYVLFGHHFAAITGAGPLVGPVLAMQFGFLPGYLWILVGVVLGGAVHDFVLSESSLTLAIALYGFAASVLPVWMLLCPRDYLSSYMKLGTIALLIAGILFVNPALEAPALSQYAHGGPVGPIVPGHLFP